jgi:hypothetical protein
VTAKSLKFLNRFSFLLFCKPNFSLIDFFHPSTVLGCERESLKINLFQPSYSVFQGFSKVKFANGGSILSSSQFSILPQLAQKMKLTSKVVEIDSKNNHFAT